MEFPSDLSFFFAIPLLEDFLSPRNEQTNRNIMWKAPNILSTQVARFRWKEFCKSSEIFGNCVFHGVKMFAKAGPAKVGVPGEPWTANSGPHDWPWLFIKFKGTQGTLFSSC